MEVKKDQKENNSIKTSDDEKIPKSSLFELFATADVIDYLLMFLGCVGGAITGK